MIDFGIDICTVLAPSWDPTWGHVDHFFAQDGGTEFKAPFFIVGSMLVFDSGALMATSWHHLGSILEGSGLHFGGFWQPFFYIFVRFGEAFVRTVLASFSKHL